MPRSKTRNRRANAANPRSVRTTKARREDATAPRSRLPKAIDQHGRTVVRRPMTFPGRQGGR